jgi:hypothetical protein
MRLLDVALVGALLLVVLVMTAVTLVRRARVRHRRADTPPDRYRSAVRDIRRLRDAAERDSERKAARLGDGGCSVKGS